MFITSNLKDLIRMMASRQTLDNMRGEVVNPKTAADKFITDFGLKLNGRGGVICMNSLGKVGLAFNTPRMAFAYRTHEVGFAVGIELSDIVI